MKVIFSEHAKLKLAQRNIAKRKVIETLRKPDMMVKTSSDRRIAYKQFNKLFLKVVFKEEKNDVVVITSRWDEEFKL